MTVKTLNYTMTELLDCVCGSDVIICVTGIAMWSDRPYLPGTILSVVQSGTYCGQKAYRYSISYESDWLLDPTQSLTTANITGIICKGCLTTYVESLISGVLAGGFWEETLGVMHLAAAYWGDPITVDGSALTALDLESLTNLTLPVTDATHGQIIQAGNPFIHTFGTENVFIGLNSGNFILTGDNNIGLGRLTLGSLTTGTNNVAIGAESLTNVVDGQYNVAIGRRAGAGVISGLYNIFIGFDAGFWETGSNKLIIDTYTRADEATQRVEALLYGVFDANPVHQILTVNGHLNVLSGQDLIFGSSTIASTIFKVRGARADGADDGLVTICGGGDYFANRGAYIVVGGNESAITGDIHLAVGDVGGLVRIFDDTSNEVWAISTDITAHVVNGGNLVFGPDGTGISSQVGGIWSPRGAPATTLLMYGSLGTPDSASIISNTIDGADDAILSVCGGGEALDTRGARIDVYGNEHVANPGRVDIVPGVAVPGDTQIWYNGNVVWTITNDISSSAVWGGNVIFNNVGTGIEGSGGALWKPEGTLTDNSLVYSDVGTPSPSAKIRASTADATDDALLHLCGGGEAAYTRGARIDLGGNEQGTYPGRINLYPGESGYVDIYNTDVLVWSITSNFEQNAANGGQIIFARTGTGIASSGAIPVEINPRGDAQRWFLFDAPSDTAHTLQFGDAGVTAAQTLTICASTSDADDDAAVYVSGGGAALDSRGSWISVHGNEHATKGGYIELSPGEAGRIDFYSLSALCWTITDNITGNATNGGDLVFQRAGKGVVDATQSLAATGSVLADAAQITYRVTFVTAADAVKGVKLPATPSVGASYRIYNTANAILLVYPGAADDQINAAGAGVAVSIAAYASLEVTALSTSQWWGGESANP